MSRDHRFEIQYLISLTVAVVGIITTEVISSFINEWIGFAFILIVAVHFVVFNIYYTFGEAINIEIDAVEYIRKESRWIWGAITIGFLLFILHTITSILFVYFSYCGHKDPIYTINLAIPLNCGMGKILISYAVPLLIVVAMGVPFRRKIWSPLRTLRDINIKIAPSKIRIFSDYDETEPLFIKIKNTGTSPYNYTLNVDLPDEVVARIDREESLGEIINENTVDPGSPSRFNIPLKYSGDEMRSGLIEVKIEHQAGTVEEEVEVLLVPQ